MSDWFRSSIRGGVAFIKQRYEKGDDNYRNIGYEKFIKYFDATNLYGSMMTYKLPYKNFKFLEQFESAVLKSKLCKNEIIDVDGSASYFCEVDLYYPPELHEVHAKWPLAPDTYEVRYEDLRFFQECNLVLAISKHLKNENLVKQNCFLIFI